MNVILLKIILLVVMAVTALIAGCIPIKLYEILKKRSKSGSHSSLIVSLLSCYAGGVILGVCLLDMLPDARESASTLRKYHSWDDYPYLELFIGVGFFIVYFLEEVIDKICIHDHEIERERRMTVSYLPDIIIKKDEILSVSTNGKTPDYGSTNSDNTSSTVNRHNTECSVEKLEEHSPAGQRKDLVSALTFVAALVIHTFLEGFAFGVQDTEVSVTSLFFGIIVHKALVMFSVGMNLTEKLPNRKMLIFALVAMLALISPLGGTVGMLIEGSDIAEKPKAIVTTIFTCFSIGCFFFITFFDILAVERKNAHNNILQWIACVLGFACVALLMLVTEGSETDDIPTACPPAAITTLQ